MNNYSFVLQNILQAIVTRRRSWDRELVLACDPLGQTCLSGLRPGSDETLWVVEVESPSMRRTGRSHRPLTIARGDLMQEVAASLGLKPSIEVCTDLLVDAVPRQMYLHFRTMAGDKLTLVGEEEELSTASIQNFLGYGTNLSSPEQRGSFNAENVVRHFTSRATTKECQLFIKLVRQNPNCVFADSQFVDKFKLDFGEDREQETWFKVLPALDREVRQRRENDDDSEQLWREITQSFEDPEGRFSQLVRLVKSLNRVVCTDNAFFRVQSRRHVVFMEAKQGFLRNAHKITQSLNAGDTEGLQRDLSILQHNLWSIQHEESDDLKRKLEAWLNDTRLNRYGIPQGVINRYRYELSFHSDNLEKGLQIKSDVLRRDNGICQYCGKEIAITRRTGQNQEGKLEFHAKFHIDHIIPLARGGTNDLGNLQILCEACNLWKGSTFENEMPPSVTRNFYKNRIKLRN